MALCESRDTYPAVNLERKITRQLNMDGDCRDELVIVQGGDSYPESPRW